MDYIKSREEGELRRAIPEGFSRGEIGFSAEILRFADFQAPGPID